MSRQIKILAYAGLAALVVVSWVSPGAGTCVPLKENFAFSADYKILNDPEAPAEKYAYVDSGKPQGNPWIWFDLGTGRFRMTVARGNTAGRYVSVTLSEPPIENAPSYPANSNCYKYAGKPDVPGNIRWFWLRAGQSKETTMETARWRPDTQH